MSQQSNMSLEEKKELKKQQLKKNQKKYNETHQKIVKERMREYNKRNRDKLNALAKKFYDENKDEILQRAKNKALATKKKCPCGGVYSQLTYQTHSKTKRCMKYHEKLFIPKEPEIIVEKEPESPTQIISKYPADVLAKYLTNNVYLCECGSIVHHKNHSHKQSKKCIESRATMAIKTVTEEIIDWDHFAE